MAARYDTEIPICRLQNGVDLLERVSPDARLLALKNLVINNGGVWPIPELPELHPPVWYEVQLFGVTAVAEEKDLLPVRWIKAAKTAIAALQEAA